MEKHKENGSLEFSERQELRKLLGRREEVSKEEGNKGGRKKERRKACKEQERR